MFAGDLSASCLKSINKNDPHRFEENCFDLNRVPGNGVLVFPLSMSRLFKGQDPRMLYDFLCFFDKKIIEKTVDVVFIYTNGLYFNNIVTSAEIRQKTNAQMLTHKRELSNIIKKDNKFSPSAIHFIPWDHLILQADNYIDMYSKLNKLKDSNPFFKKLLHIEVKESLDEKQNNYAFIIEETIVTYLIRNKLVSLPHTLSNSQGWQLLFYPGTCLIPDVYLHQEKHLLPNESVKNSDWFNKLTSASMYNMEKKVLIDYNKINLNRLKYITKDDFINVDQTGVNDF